MIKFYHKIHQQLVSQDATIIRGRSILLILMLLSSSYIFSQNRNPPPPCYGNGNAGYGGAVGEGQFLFSGEFSNPINFNMYTGANGTNIMDHILVLYIDTGAPGRNEIGFTVDDSTDDHRIAISNSNMFGNGSIIKFPPGFEASYAVAVDTISGGLYSIPSTGAVGVGDLDFITSVNSTLTASTQIGYDFNFNWEDLGLTITEDEFSFVGLYVSNFAYSSDEGYGAGIAVGTEGSDDITFTGFLTLPGCNATLSTTVNATNTMNASYFNDQLVIKGINEVATISVYDILGRELYRDDHQIQESVSIPLALHKNELQFIVIESATKKKILKVIPN